MWVARNVDGSLRMFISKPNRIDEGCFQFWEDSSNDNPYKIGYKTDNNLFPNLEWKDEPIEVVVMKKNENNKNEDFPIIQKMNKVYMAFLEEKCHVHPSSYVKFEEDEPGVVRVIIGGFDCGICFSDTDVLSWLIKDDIKYSDIKNYDTFELND